MGDCCACSGKVEPEQRLVEGVQWVGQRIARIARFALQRGKDIQRTHVVFQEQGIQLGKALKQSLLVERQAWHGLRRIECVGHGPEGGITCRNTRCQLCKRCCLVAGAARCLECGF